MSRHSASKSSLLLSGCTYWARPEVPWYDESYRDKTDQDNGNELHGYIHDYALGNEVSIHQNGRSPAEYAVAVRKFTHMKAFFESVREQSDSVSTEVCYEADLETGECVRYESIGHRQYKNVFSDRSCSMVGTVDLEWSIGTHRGIDDWKTGKSGSEEQILTLCLLKVLHEPNIAVFGRLLFVDDQKGIIKKEVYPSPEDLAKHRTRLIDAIRSVPTSKPITGSHCLTGFCNHMAHCNAIQEKRLFGISVKPGPQMTSVKLTESITSDQQAGQMMEYLSAVNRRYKHYNEVVRKYITDGGHAPSPDGKMEYCETNSGFRWVKK